MFIHFIGDYKKLIPMEYQFSRLYARNYICYHKEDVWIWKKGKRVEISDFYSKSHAVLSYLIENNFSIPNEFNLVMLNKETFLIEDYERTKHSDVYLFDKLSEEEMEKFYKRYSQKFLNQETLDCLQNLYQLNLIEIREDNG